MSYRILIVEDEAAIRAGLEEKLRREGFIVRSAADGETADRMLRDDPPDLVVLDLMLPGMDGLAVLRELRKRQPDLPVLILSARGAEQEKVRGLREGADDYLAKPFGLDELMARIDALLRRAYGSDEQLSFGTICIEPQARRVLRGDDEVVLSPKEFDLLLCLVRNIGHVLSRDEILDRVWGDHLGSDARSVDYHVLNLRKKLEEDPASPRYLVTRHGVGYTWVAQ